MKSTLFSIAALLAVAGATTNDEGVRRTAFGKLPTQTSPVTLITEYGPVQNYGYFTQLMEDKIHRHLQTAQSGAGFGNDPDACSSDGVKFTCLAPFEFSAGENVTLVSNTIQCDLNDQITFDFQDAENCVCNSMFNQSIVNSTEFRIRNCACGVCPKGSPTAVSMDCSVVPEDPYVLGQCYTVDCDGRCDGGPIVINQPNPDEQQFATPAPSGALMHHGMKANTVGAVVMSLVWIVA